jgi:hypothetical protein
MRRIRRSLFHAGFGLLLLSVFSGCSGSGSPSAGEFSASPTPTGFIPTDARPAPTPALSGPVSIGDPFLLCGTAVTVAGWSEVAPGEFFRPKSGNRFLAVDVVLVNLGDRALETVWFTFTLLDAYSEPVKSGVFPMTLAHGTQLVGGMAPGERARGMTGFEAPAGEQEFSLEAKCLNPDTGGTEAKVVALGSQPKALAPPGRFAGEAMGDPLPVGAVARVRGVDVSLRKVLPFPDEALDPDADPRVSPPPEWMKYLVVDVALINNGTGLFHFVTFTDLYAKDPAGWRYPLISWANQVLEDPLRDVELAPGKKESGQAVLEVPADAGHLYLVVENGYGSAAERAVFLLA